MKHHLSTEELFDFFVKWQERRLSSAEETRLKTWRAAAREHEDEWQQLTALWQSAAPPEAPNGTPKDFQWQKLLEALPAGEAPRTVSRKPGRWQQRLVEVLRARPVWAFAGAAIILLIVLQRFDFGGESQAWQRVAVPHGERQQMRLADGSIVELNAGSTLKYPARFSAAKREVELEGEAFFEVQSASTPFEVKTIHASVRVLGTSFNVRTWENATQVFVKTGRVGIAPKQSSTENEIFLTPGLAAICDTVAVLLTRVPAPEDVLAWREGKLVFRDRPLPEVLAELQRHFAISIQADDRLMRHNITAQFAQEPAADVIAAIAIAIHARAEATATGYWLREK